MASIVVWNVREVRCQLDAAANPGYLYLQPVREHMTWQVRLGSVPALAVFAFGGLIVLVVTYLPVPVSSLSLLLFLLSLTHPLPTLVCWYLSIVRARVSISTSTISFVGPSVCRFRSR